MNDEQELPENTKVYADFEDNSYTFDLDAAYVYYFSASADVAYAGDQNFTSMSFGANLDNDTVGAEGTIAYLSNEESANSVTAYYLYHDEEGVYFDTKTYFDRMEVTDQTTMTGIDYSCHVTLSYNSRQNLFLWCIITKTVKKFPKQTILRRKLLTIKPLNWTVMLVLWRLSAMMLMV